MRDDSKSMHICVWPYESIRLGKVNSIRWFLHKLFGTLAYMIALHIYYYTSSAHITQFNDLFQPLSWFMSVNLLVKNQNTFSHFMHGYKKKSTITTIPTIPSPNRHTYCEWNIHSSNFWKLFRYHIYTAVVHCIRFIFMRTFV